MSNHKFTPKKHSLTFSYLNKGNTYETHGISFIQETENGFLATKNNSRHFSSVTKDDLEARISFNRWQRLKPVDQIKELRDDYLKRFKENPRFAHARHSEAMAYLEGINAAIALLDGKTAKQQDLIVRESQSKHKIMALNKNKVELAGRLTQDVEVRFTNSGAAVADICVACNSRRKKPNSNEYEEVTEFVNVTVWKQAAEFLGNYAKKGSEVLVEGLLKVEKWTDAESQKQRSALKVHSNNVQMPALSNGGQQQQQKTQQKQQYQAPPQQQGQRYNQQQQPQQRQYDQSQQPPANQNQEPEHDDDIPF